MHVLKIDDKHRRRQSKAVDSPIAAAERIIGGRHMIFEPTRRPKFVRIFAPDFLVVMQRIDVDRHDLAAVDFQIAERGRGGGCTRDSKRGDRVQPEHLFHGRLGQPQLGELLVAYALHSMR